MPPYSIVKKSETQTAIISLGSDGIVRVMGKKNSEIDYEQMRKNIKAYNEVIEGKSYPFLYFAEDDSVVFNHDAMRYSEGHQESFPKICIAVLVENLSHKIVANFYLKFSQPKIPYKIFTTAEAAEEWCLLETTNFKKNMKITV